MTGYVESLPRGLVRAREERCRTCPVTGLRVYAGAQALTVANAVAAVLALAVGGLFGLLIGLTRSPGLQLLGPKSFYAALTGHGVAALILWPIFFEVAAMVFASTILLNARVFSMKLGWASFALMVLGSFMLIGVTLAGKASVAFTAYPPLVADQTFYLGYLIFAVGALVAIANFALSIVKARADQTFTGSLPLITYGVGCACILALVSILSGLVALVPAWLYSLGWIGNVEPIVYRGWFWGLGHTLQYVNVIAMVVAWYGIAALVLKAGPVNQKFTRFAFILYLLITVPVLGHHFLVDPSIGTDVKVVGGSAMGFGLGIPSLMHGLAVMGGVEASQRRRGVTGLFGWFKAINWRHAGVASLAGSLLLFALGGWTGTVETTLQFNMVTHNTMWVPAHIHQIVVGGTTLAFMGFAYYLVPMLVGRELWSHRLAVIQAYMYAGGLFLMSSAQWWAGFLGVPRRDASISYGGEMPHGWALPMNIAGVGAGLSSAAGALFVVLMVLTLVRGKRTDDAERLVPSAVS
jgi:cytochrome c oxidase subunit 1